MEAAKALREHRDNLRDRREVAALEAEISALESQQKLQEAFTLLEVGTVLGDKSGFLTDHPNFGLGSITSTFDTCHGFRHYDQIDDRQDGRYRPLYEVENDLNVQRGIWRVLAAVDEHGIGAVETLGNYTLGTGYVYEATPKNEQDQPLADLCQAVLDEFTSRERQNWRRKEREFHDRSRRDGETFLGFKPIPGGRAACEFVEPAEVTEPIDQRNLSEVAGQIALDWKMGVGSEFRNPTEVFGYFRTRDVSQVDAEFIPTNRMVHAKRNVDEVAKRGVSDFFPIWKDLERAAKVLRNTGEGAALQSAIAYIREHLPGVGPQAVNTMLNSNGNVGEINATWPGGPSTSTQFRKYNPGTILDVPSGQQYKAGPMGSERNEGFQAVADAIWRSAGVRWTMPSYMITGDPSAGNFAGILVAESPFVKARESDQSWYAEEYLECMWIVLEIAVNTNPNFAAQGVGSIRDLKRRVDIAADPPRVSVRNRIEETQISAILHERGQLSGRSWAGKEDLDFDRQQKEIEDEKQKGIGGHRDPNDIFGDVFGSSDGMGGQGSPFGLPAPGSTSTKEQPKALGESDQSDRGKGRKQTGQRRDWAQVWADYP